MSVDRNAKGRIKASHIPSFFNNIKNKVTVDTPQMQAETIGNAGKTSPGKRKETGINLQDQSLLLSGEYATVAVHGNEIEPYPKVWYREPDRPTSK